ncbi:MAG: sugar ABC transporter permease [Clostridiales bacterium]|nr:sugar ABC transporter permease [Clostridiales bacterium]
MKMSLGEKAKNIFRQNTQLLIAVIAIVGLLLFNLIRDPSFYNISIVDSIGGPKLTGNIIEVLDNATELVLIAIGMTLVTASCGGQDISVGAIGVISATVFTKSLILMCPNTAENPVAIPGILLALLLAIIVSVLFGLFNGTLVSVFHIQPMIATLILFTCGRDVAYWIGGTANLIVPSNDYTSILANVIPGIPIPTPILITILFAVIFFLIFRFTSLRLYTQSVGINQSAARLNGINSTAIKLICFGLLGLCCAMAGIISETRLLGVQKVSYGTLMQNIEMEAILAVAIGGNALGGGKFRIVGSVLGAYAYKLLTRTLYCMGINIQNIRAYQAVVIIILVVVSSSEVKTFAAYRWAKIKNHFSGASSEKEAAGLQ